MASEKAFSNSDGSSTLSKDSTGTEIVGATGAGRLAFADFEDAEGGLAYLASTYKGVHFPNGSQFFQVIDAFVAFSQHETKVTTQSRAEAALWFDRIAFLRLERCMDLTILRLRHMEHAWYLN